MVDVYVHGIYRSVVRDGRVEPVPISLSYFHLPYSLSCVRSLQFPNESMVAMYERRGAKRVERERAARVREFGLAYRQRAGVVGSSASDTVAGPLWP